jgi:hypothetical protein
MQVCGQLHVPVTLSQGEVPPVPVGIFDLYEVRLQSSWTHHITPSRNFVEVR